MAKLTFSRDIISSPVVILTGAGASAALGKPTTREFMDLVESDFTRSFGKIYTRVVDSARKMSDDGVADVELLLERLRRSVEAAGELERDANFGSPSQDLVDKYETLERSLQERVVSEYADVDEDKAVSLYGPLWDSSRAAKALPSMATLPLFTLNYDVAVERAFSRLDGRLVDGLVRVGPLENVWSADVYHTYQKSDDTTLVLFKLHGSVTWGRAPDGQRIVELPPGMRKDPAPYTHVIKYPYLTQKDLSGEPYETSYAYFRACLQNTSTLIVIGCSLRDEAVTSAIHDAFRSNKDLLLLIFDPSVNSGAIQEKLQFPRQRGQRVILSARKFSPESAKFVGSQIVRFLRTGARRSGRRRAIA